MHAAGRDIRPVPPRGNPWVAALVLVSYASPSSAQTTAGGGVQSNGEMAATQRAFSVDDLYLHQKVMAVSASAACAVFSVRSVDRERDTYVTRLWTLDGDRLRQLTHGQSTDRAPQLSPSGKVLAFVSNRSGSPQIHLMELAGGEARQLGSFEMGVTAIAWCPDERFLLATAAVRVDPDLRRSGARAAPKERRSSAEVAWRLPFKTDGIGYQLAREIHLFKVDVATGAAQQLTDGLFDVYGFQVSPNGDAVAYSRSRAGRFAHRTDLWLCALDGTGERRLTEEIATVMEPVWSPDGRQVAFIGAVREGDAQSRFWVCDRAGGPPRPVGDESVEPASGESFRWRADGGALQFLRAHRGRHCPAQLHVASGKVSMAEWPDRQASAFAATEAALFYCVDHPSLPSELWTCAANGSGERRLSRLNAWWDERTPVEAQIRTFDVPDGRGGREQIEGWLIRASGADRPGPLLNDAHGGPASYALMDFDTNVFWQALCSQGWSVLALNAVGSASYGREFCNRLAGHWGEFDLPQHIAAIGALQAEGVCDERLAISGKSYGGFLSAYAIGDTDLFKAAVVMAPVGNIETHYGTSDGGYYADPLYMDTAPEFDRNLARKLSPMVYVEKSVTPTLFLQGKEDERCPKCQSEELFVSMYRAGRAASELVLYAGETHHFLGEGKPSTREDAAARIIDWISAHAGKSNQGARVAGHAVDLA